MKSIVVGAAVIVTILAVMYLVGAAVYAVGALPESERNGEIIDGFLVVLGLALWVTFLHIVGNAVLTAMRKGGKR